MSTTTTVVLIFFFMEVYVMVFFMVQFAVDVSFIAVESDGDVDFLAGDNAHQTYASAETTTR